jgi:hypothetical protein
LEAYVDQVSPPSKFSIFWEMEQDPTMRLAGIPIEPKFYLIGNAVIARGLFRYTGAAGLGAPVRICVSQRDGEETRIDLDQVTVPSSANFLKWRHQMFPGCWIPRWSRSAKTPPPSGALGRFVFSKLQYCSYMKTILTVRPGQIATEQIRSRKPRKGAHDEHRRRSTYRS